ncbi:hypothetical protein FIV42_19675 [Persicimonas caeni]|uniref:Porin n=1 Tax=Persicimonas caeni TaxID=2292766 RepID=A0A4Y6PXC6_PERCE|nr:porin [Persicimonas caeni]QDG52880.1 hypothetical protein FIV42_19675 [Persicimonas caeni]QED34102.1 hypothetical protein FRD00_19670 [Persicimonas caeni]
MYPDVCLVCPKRLTRSLVVLLALLFVSSSASAQGNDPKETVESNDAQSTGVAGYDDGFFIAGQLDETDDDGNEKTRHFRLEIGGRLQTQYDLLIAEEGEDLDLARSRFLIRRARLNVTGHFVSPDFTYAMQAAFDRGNPELLDYFVNYAFEPGTFEGRLGQWRVPFLRTEINSSGSLLLVDRSLTTSVFGEGFDAGMGIHNNYKKSPPFEWFFGVFNGTQTDLEVVSFDDANTPTFFYPSVVGRVAYNYGDIKGYSTGDLKGGPLRFSLGASGMTQFGLQRDNESATKATVDYILKAHGFSTSGAFMLATNQDGEALTDQNLFVTGLFVQAGYFLSEMIQPAARYSRVDYEGDDELVHEALGGLNVYFWGHSLKWQTDAGAIIVETPNDTDTAYRLRTQLTLSF